jgi:hypothetical protein
MLGFVFNRYYHFTTDWDPERLTTDVVLNVDNLLRHNPFPHLPSLLQPTFPSSCLHSAHLPLLAPTQSCGAGRLMCSSVSNWFLHKMTTQTFSLYNVGTGTEYLIKVLF